jgi:O-antigen/teichoic acid export membrane protein
MFSSLIDKFNSSPFAKNVAIVATGTAGAQAINIAFAPIITRLYGPEAFGVLGTFMAITAVFTPIAALTYPIAIVLPKRDADALGLARLSLLIAAGITLLLGLLLLVFKAQIVELLNLQTITSFVLLVPLFMLFSACLQVVRQWLIRKKQFSITARVGVATAFIVSSAKTVFGLINPVAAVLVVLATVGSALNAALLVIGARKTPQITTEADTSPTTPLRELAKRHQDFPFFRAPQMFISTISLNLPVLLLASFFGPAAAGFYSIGRSVLGLPSILITNSVGDVFYPRITEAAHKGENLTRLIVKATLALGAVGVLPFGLVIILGPWLFGLVFGAKWVLAGEYARWLALWSFFSFMNTPSVRSIPVLSLQGIFLAYEVIGVILRVAALGVGFYIFLSDILAVAIFSLVNVLLNFSLILITICAAKKIDLENDMVKT